MPRGADLVALGVDVGVGKGYDLVMLDGHRVVVHRQARAQLSDLEAVLTQLRPATVAIDGPPAWAASGRSRSIERDLHRLGIACFPTPAVEHVLPLHGWMRCSFSAFATAAAAGYPLFTGTEPFDHHALEVFPHASGVVLRGSLADRGMPKAAWRRAVLEAAGVDTEPLASLDQLDAALAALTGLFALEGNASWIADGAAALVLPIRPLPVTRFARDRVASRTDT